MYVGMVCLLEGIDNASDKACVAASFEFEFIEQRISMG